MYRLAGTFAIMLLCAVAAMAQTPAQTIQVGYAVVTPAFPSPGAMIVFESLTRALTPETLEATVVPPRLAMSALVPVDVSSSASTNTGIAIANPNAALTSVTLTLRRSDGTPLTATTITISARRQTSKLLTELFPGAVSGGFSTQSPIPAEFTGTLLISSTSPVSILGLKLRGATYSVVPVTDLAPANIFVPLISTGVGGSEAVLLPQFVIGDGWGTEIEILNTTAAAITVRLDVFTPEGVPMPVKLNGVTAGSFPNLVVPANGLLKLKP